MIRYNEILQSCSVNYRSTLAHRILIIKEREAEYRFIIQFTAMAWKPHNLSLFSVTQFCTEINYAMHKSKSTCYEQPCTTIMYRKYDK